MLKDSIICRDFSSATFAHICCSIWAHQSNNCTWSEIREMSIVWRPFTRLSSWLPGTIGGRAVWAKNSFIETQGVHQLTLTPVSLRQIFWKWSVWGDFLKSRKGIGKRRNRIKRHFIGLPPIEVLRIFWHLGFHIKIHLGLNWYQSTDQAIRVQTKNSYPSKSF